MNEAKTCDNCNGLGYTLEHDPSDTTEQHMLYGNCTTCPVQEQCMRCQGTGLIQ